MKVRNNTKADKLALKTLFFLRMRNPAGEDEVEQLLCIMEVMGVPPPHLIDTASRKKVFFDANNQPTVVPNSRGALVLLFRLRGLVASLTCLSASTQQLCPQQDVCAAAAVSMPSAQVPDPVAVLRSLCFPPP
jgi:hypothetical protein